MEPFTSRSLNRLLNLNANLDKCNTCWKSLSFKKRNKLNHLQKTFIRVFRNRLSQPTETLRWTQVNWRHFGRTVPHTGSGVDHYSEEYYSELYLAQILDNSPRISLGIIIYLRLLKDVTIRGWLAGAIFYEKGSIENSSQQEILRTLSTFTPHVDSQIIF